MWGRIIKQLQKRSSLFQEDVMSINAVGDSELRNSSSRNNNPLAVLQNNENYELLAGSTKVGNDTKKSK